MVIALPLMIGCYIYEMGSGLSGVKVVIFTLTVIISSSLFYKHVGYEAKIFERIMFFNIILNILFVFLLLQWPFQSIGINTLVLCQMIMGVVFVFLATYIELSIWRS